MNWKFYCFVFLWFDNADRNHTSEEIVKIQDVLIVINNYIQNRSEDYFVRLEKLFKLVKLIKSQEKLKLNYSTKDFFKRWEAV